MMGSFLKGQKFELPKNIHGLRQQDSAERKQIPDSSMVDAFGFYRQCVVGCLHCVHLGAVFAEMKYSSHTNYIFLQ